MRRVDAQGGFTLTEVLISLVVMTIGLMGILALYNTTTRANADSRRLDRARMMAEQLMEEVRGMAIEDVEAVAGTRFPDEINEGSDATRYRRELAVAPVSGFDNLVRIEIAVSFAEGGDESSRRYARLEMIRTRQERL